MDVVGRFCYPRASVALWWPPRHLSLDPFLSLPCSFYSSLVEEGGAPKALTGHCWPPLAFPSFSLSPLSHPFLFSFALFLMAFWIECSNCTNRLPVWFSTSYIAWFSMPETSRFGVVRRSMDVPFMPVKDKQVMISMSSFSLIIVQFFTCLVGGVGLYNGNGNEWLLFQPFSWRESHFHSYFREEWECFILISFSFLILVTNKICSGIWPFRFPFQSILILAMNQMPPRCILEFYCWIVFKELSHKQFQNCIA